MSNESMEPTPITNDDYESRITHLESIVSELTKTVVKKRSRDPTHHSHDELLRYYQKREEINARRRAAYKAKKAASAGTP